MQPEPLIYREDVTAMLFMLSDISLKLTRIVDLLEEEYGEEEEDYEDDA